MKIEYEVGGVVYRDWHYDIDGSYSSSWKNASAILGTFDIYDPAKDNRSACWYDPTNPAAAVLVRGYSGWQWLLFTVPISFVVIGAGGLIYAMLRWGKSAERQAAIVQKSARAGFLSRRRNWATTLSLCSRRRRHDQQPRHAAAISFADGQFAGLGLVWHAGVLLRMEWHRGGAGRLGRPRIPGC